jgi:hypothetical protein
MHYEGWRKLYRLLVNLKGKNEQTNLRVCETEKILQLIN